MAIMDGIRETHAPTWQPIETAPKDGSRILVWNAFVGVYSTEYCKGEWPCGFYDQWFGHFYPVPSHWMPIPRTPQEISRDGEDVPDATFELHQDGMSMAMATGPREVALSEALHYAVVYAQDGPVELFELVSVPLPEGMTSPRVKLADATKSKSPSP